MEALPDRFLDKVVFEPNTGCWLWMGSLTGKGYKTGRGYGSFYYQGRMIPAHKFSYETLIGHVPTGYVLDHYVCDTTFCVNPYHVKPATDKANILRGSAPPAINSRMTHCQNGHALLGHNIRIHSSTGGRICRICRHDVYIRTGK